MIRPGQLQLSPPPSPGQASTQGVKAEGKQAEHSQVVRAVVEDWSVGILAKGTAAHPVSARRRQQQVAAVGKTRHSLRLSSQTRA